MRTAGVLGVLLGLVALALCQSSFIPVDPVNCTVRSMSNGTTWFYERPQNPGVALSQCPEYTGNSCCTPAYMDAITAHIDLLANDLHEQLTNIPPQCEADFHKITCSPCAPDSDVYFEHVWADYFDLYVCRSFCNRMFLDCGSATVRTSGRTVADTYGNGDMFCNDIFIQTNLFGFVLPDSDRHCLDPLYTRDCTPDDISFHYTECINGKRNLQYSWKPTSNCTGGILLPRSIADLPCPVTCSSGQYLPLGTTLCQTCPSGTYSLGGGHRVDRWDEWPTRYIELTTYCLNEKDELVPDCGWELVHDFIESNISGIPDTKSVLETRVLLDHDGNVSFVARVDSEYGWDRFLFYIDSQENWIKNTIIEKEFTFSLSKGWHTLKWVYAKDSTIDLGMDDAMISSITVTALSTHDDYCEACPPGTTSTVGASGCTRCGANTYAPNPGTPSCLPCPADTYSFPGASTCIPRQPCVAADYRGYSTGCHANGTRTTYYRWIEPMICIETTVHLPLANYSDECLDCNPGYYRDGDDCIFCPEGQFSTLGTEGRCTDCWPGAVAAKSLDLMRWDEFPDNVRHECTGDCGSTEWRLMGEYVDSGVNHGNYVDIAFSFPVEIVGDPYGDLTMEYKLECESDCYLEVWYDDAWLTSIWGGYEDDPTNFTRAGPYHIPKGKHNITVLFGKWWGTRNNDRAIIDRVTIDGVKEGGATECTTCPVGTISAGLASTCTLCPAGQTSDANHTHCVPCPAGTYNDIPGSTCKPCGHGIDTPAGSTQCSLNGCRYNPPGSVDTYDLSPLGNKERPWGPLTEYTYTSYYLSPCQPTGNTNNSCIDRDGNPLNTYACQYSTLSGYATDLGRITGFHTYSGTEGGVIMELTDGTPGCGNPWFGIKAFPRSTNITFICDPSAGTGQPTFASTLHPSSCVYHFEWRSLYACPVCRPDHYEEIPGPCLDGKQTIQYQWKTNPRVCHSGAPLPAPITVDCSVAQSCPVGTYLSLGDKCEGCPDGTFSLGNGEVFSDFGSDMEPFTSTCDSVGCSAWSVKDGQLVSGAGISTLEVVRNFKAATSTVEFDYRLSAHNSRLLFYVDSDIAYNDGTLSQGYETAKVAVTVGSHRLRWVFMQGAPAFPDARSETALIRQIRLVGSIQAVTNCTRCPFGQISNDDRGGCHACPLNTKAVNGKCTPCSADTFRLPGPATDCQPRTPCTLSDWQPVYPNLETLRCGASATPQYDLSYQAQAPQICSGVPPAAVKKTECVPCPRGLVWQSASGSCKPCPAGTYVKGTECAPVAEGYAAVPEASFFFPGDVRATLPSEFATSCSGSCGSNGWRMRPDGTIDSGVHNGAADSSLTLLLEVSHAGIAQAPRIEFDIAADARAPKRAHGDVFVEFFLDDRVQAVHIDVGERQHVSLPLHAHASTGTALHSFRWLYAQLDSSPDAHVVLSNLRVVGAVTGGAVEQIRCPAGSYVDRLGCHMCPAGTFSTKESSQACTPCPANAVSEPGATNCTECSAGFVAAGSHCVPSCIFGGSDAYFNLSALRDAVTVDGIFTLSACQLLPAPSGCSRCSDGFVFQRQGTTVYSLGQNLVYNGYSYNPNDPRPRTFDLIYEGSDSPPAGCPAGIKTTIQFRCDLSIGRGQPQLISESGLCDPTFRWETTHACRICTEADLIKEFGVCSGGKRDVLYRANATCVLGPTFSVPSTEACTSIEIDGFLGGGVLIGVSICIIMLVGIAIFFWKRKREVETKYEILRNEIPMGDIDLDDAPPRRRPAATNDAGGIDLDDSDDK